MCKRTKCGCGDAREATDEGPRTRTDMSFPIFLVLGTILCSAVLGILGPLSLGLALSSVSCLLVRSVGTLGDIVKSARKQRELSEPPHGKEKARETKTLSFPNGLGLRLLLERLWEFNNPLGKKSR